MDANAAVAVVENGVPVVAEDTAEVKNRAVNHPNPGLHLVPNPDAEVLQKTNKEICQ